MEEIQIIIKGFKTIEEAEQWCDAYSGGVEQEMGNWAQQPIGDGDGYNFPCFEESIIKESNKIIMTLTHPDTYDSQYTPKN